MSDVDHDLLYDLAEAQAGYFTPAQAIEAGMDRSTLSHHARPGGRFERIQRGLYRLRHFPTSPNEHVMAAWLPLRNAGAVVSHVSALELYSLSDIIPETIHLTVPRTKRGLRPRAEVRVHTVERPIRPEQARTIDGLPVTSPERSLADALADGAQPEQIELAVRQALERALTTPGRLRDEVAERPARIRGFIDRAIEQVTP